MNVARLCDTQHTNASGHNESYCSFLHNNIIDAELSNVTFPLGLVCMHTERGSLHSYNVSISNSTYTEPVEQFKKQNRENMFSNSPTLKFLWMKAV